ncbi:MAG: hypothetical protein JXM70_00660 [Pirellulales bacterium]|nr:hypothetical protein [Pirellulales bacterium]
MNVRFCIMPFVSLLIFVCVACPAATLTQADLDRGAVPKPGDEIILRDFSRLTPKDAMTTKSQRGKWWLRPYREKDGANHTMLMTVERDMQNPETCIVPTVTYPLGLDGWYEVWIATYRGPYGGGVDVRVSNDDCFVHIDPQQVAFHAKRPKPRVGAIVEMNYKPCENLSGQSLLIRQPFGTYESWHWGRCDAALAYIRLVKLSDKEVAAFKADQARTDRRVIAYDDDNFSRYWMWGGESKEKVLRIFEPFRYHDVEFISLCLGVPGMLKVPSPYNIMYYNNGRRLGDKRMATMYKDFVAKDIDFLNLAAERAHKYGIKLLPGWRMSSGNGAARDKSLAKCYLKTTNRLDFAYPQVREYFVNTVRHVLENHDVDGFILNFTRHCVHFNPDEPNKEAHMNSLSADMRKMVDEVSKKKGKKLLLGASFSESHYVSGFLKYNLKIDVGPEERLKYQGINVADWVKNSYYDIIMPEGHHIEKYIEMTRGTTTKCYPRWEYHSTMYGPPVGANIHDPTPGEDKKDRAINPHNGPRDFEAGWLKLHDKGADGLFMFNNPMGWVSLRRMGHIDEVCRRVKAGEVYGVIEGPEIEFLQP